MKKLLSFFKDLWISSGDDILEFLFWLFNLAWFGYIVSIVYPSDSAVVGKILFTIWSLVLAFVIVAYKSTHMND